MYTVLFKDLELPPHRAHVHVTRLVGPRSSTPHAHDFYEIFLVTEGTGTHHLNGKEIALMPGHLVAIRPTDNHWYSAKEGQCLQFVDAAVSADWWRAFHTVYGLPPWSENYQNGCLNGPDTQHLATKLQGLGSANDTIGVMQIWKQAIDHLIAPVDLRAHAPPAWLETLREQIYSQSADLSEPISFWQERSGCSAEHLSRSCRRFYAITFRELINRARVEHAKLLLRTTDKKVITVAFDCGFGNMANFHRCFARLAGMTPNRWRISGSATVPVGA